MVQWFSPPSRWAEAWTARICQRQLLSGYSSSSLGSSSIQTTPATGLAAAAADNPIAWPPVPVTRLIAASHALTALLEPTSMVESMIHCAERCVPNDWRQAWG